MVLFRFVFGVVILLVSMGTQYSWQIHPHNNKRKIASLNSPLSILPLPLSSSSPIAATTTTPSQLGMNILSDVGDFLTGGKLQPQTEPLVYGEPLGGQETVSSDDGDIRTFAVQERAISFTGEDFDIYDLDNNEPYCCVRGAMMHLPGKDKMRISINDNHVATLDRKLMAITPTYDILRGRTGEKIGWLEKATIALTDTFEFYAENNPHFGPIKLPPSYKLEGDFLDRRFIMKNSNGEAVAKITKDRLIEFDQFDHYQIRIAPGMDPILVIACACAIDEEFDEEHKKRRKEA